MKADIEEITDSEGLVRALEESNQRPVLLFKHSIVCSISSRALREVEGFLASTNRIGGRVIVVQRSRMVSDEAGARLKIKHETPQVILIKGNKSVWTTSHLGITAEALEQAVAAISEPSRIDQVGCLDLSGNLDPTAGLPDNQRLT